MQGRPSLPKSIFSERRHVPHRARLATLSIDDVQMTIASTRLAPGWIAEHALRIELHDKRPDVAALLRVQPITPQVAIEPVHHRRDVSQHTLDGTRTSHGFVDVQLALPRLVRRRERMHL